MVRKAPSRTSEEALTPAAASREVSSSAGASRPVTETSEGEAPRAARFTATLAAPPQTEDSEVTRTTGTGASGEMRFTEPLT
jgi:hypothetical protein